MVEIEQLRTMQIKWREWDIR